MSCVTLPRGTLLFNQPDLLIARDHLFVSLVQPQVDYTDCGRALDRLDLERAPGHGAELGQHRLRLLRGGGQRLRHLLVHALHVALEVIPEVDSNNLLLLHL